MRSLLLVLVSAVALGAACSTSNAVGPDDGPDSGTFVPEAGSSGKLPCNVDKILADNCRKCHSDPPQFGAPMPLVTWANLHAPAASNGARKVYELVPERIANDAAPMPQPPNPRLSTADRGTLTSWSAAGAPQGTDNCSVTPPKPNDIGVTCKPDLTLGSASAWDMPTNTGDEYVCYGVEVSPPTAKHAVGFVPRIDNSQIVHHVLLFEADEAFSSTPTPCSSGGALGWRIVTGWAPGGKGFQLPPDVGFPLATGGAATHYVVQVHYSNPQALTGQTDKSGFDVCTSDPRKYEADVLAFGTQRIDIPAGAEVEKICSVRVPSQLQGLHLIASMPHMHKLGTDMSTKLFEGGPTGPAQDLGTVAGWSFNSQAWLPIGSVEGVVTKANDVIQTRCKYKNSTGQRVKFGENTADEMCYSFTVYYPRINASTWSWAYPAVTSQCSQ